MVWFSEKIIAPIETQQCANWEVAMSCDMCVMDIWHSLPFCESFKPCFHALQQNEFPYTAISLQIYMNMATLCDYG